MLNTMSNTRSNTSGVTTFKSQPVITSAILANTDSSTNIATTAWSNAFWTYVKTLSNTWSGTQTFSDVNATYFTLRSNSFNNTTNSCFLDTNQKTTLVTQFNIGVTYTEEVYIGNGAQLKKIVIGNTATTAASEIKIGNSNSTTTILGTTNIVTSGSSNVAIGNSGNTTSIKSNDVDIGDYITGTGGISIGAYANTTTGFIGIGSRNLDAIYIKAKTGHFNHDGGNSVIGNSTGTTTILGTTTIGNNSAPGYTEIASKGITLGRFMNASGYIDVAAQATGGYMVLGSANMTTNYLRGETININDTGTGTTNIGNTAGGNIFINRPLRPQYSPPADSLAGLSILGGIFSNTTGFVYTIGTTLTAFAPLNNLPAGRYLFQVYVFMPPFLPSTNIEAVLVFSSSSISNNQTSGFTVIFGGNETYTATQVGSFSVNPFFQSDVFSPNVNIAVACKSGTGLPSPSVFTVKAIRIG